MEIILTDGTRLRWRDGEWRPAKPTWGEHVDVGLRGRDFLREAVERAAEDMKREIRKTGAQSLAGRMGRPEE